MSFLRFSNPLALSGYLSNSTLVRFSKQVRRCLVFQLHVILSLCGCPNNIALVKFPNQFVNCLVSHLCCPCLVIRQFCPFQVVPTSLSLSCFPSNFVIVSMSHQFCNFLVFQSILSLGGFRLILSLSGVSKIPSLSGFPINSLFTNHFCPCLVNPNNYNYYAPF